MRHAQHPTPCTRCGLPPSALVHHASANGHGYESDPNRCVGCRRTFADSETGYHAARHWITTPAGALVCRTCQQRSRRGALDLAAILATSTTGAQR